MLCTMAPVKCYAARPVKMLKITIQSSNKTPQRFDPHHSACTGNTHSATTAAANARTAPPMLILTVSAPLLAVAVGAEEEPVDVAAWRVDGTDIGMVGETMEVFVNVPPELYTPAPPELYTPTTPVGNRAAEVTVVMLAEVTGAPEAEECKVDAVELEMLMLLALAELEYDGLLIPNCVLYWKVPSASLMSWIP